VQRDVDSVIPTMTELCELVAAQMKTARSQTSDSPVATEAMFIATVFLRLAPLMESGDETGRRSMLVLLSECLYSG
jgi:hypothetical protein